jgi:hypothetical protein
MMLGYRHAWRWLRLAAVWVPAVALWLLPAVWYFVYRPSPLSMAVVSTAAVLGLLMYGLLFLSWRDMTLPARRYWRDLRYRRLTRHIDREMGRRKRT